MDHGLGAEVGQHEKIGEEFGLKLLLGIGSECNSYNMSEDEESIELEKFEQGGVLECKDDALHFSTTAAVGTNSSRDWYDTK